MYYKVNTIKTLALCSRIEHDIRLIQTLYTDRGIIGILLDKNTGELLQRDIKDIVLEVEEYV